jgi:DNA polymerase III alpha subunit
MIIVDGSYVGIESGQKYRRFGAEARHGGFIFLSMEDEVGIANVIVAPDLYERDRLVLTQSKFLLVVGFLQNQDGVVVLVSPMGIRTHRGADL